jgi:Vitamin K-dependent gamma-carboxylase, lumenal domain/HTTM domain
MLTDPSIVWMMNHGALTLDLLAVPLLLWRRTRLATFLVLVAFHLLNVWLFGLYIFPWLMIAATTVFFDPDWPRAVATRARALTAPARAGLANRTADDNAALPPETVPSPPDRPPRRGGRLLMAFLAAWAVVQLVAPLRHLAIAGHPNWTEEGHRFAWHMMLRSKSGTVTYEVETEGGVVLVDPRDHLTDRQYAGLVGHPQRLVQFAHHLSALHDGAEVRAKTDVSLNGRDRQPIVDPTADLAAVPTWWFGRQDVILPLAQPLR